MADPASDPGALHITPVYEAVLEPYLTNSAELDVTDGSVAGAPILITLGILAAAIVLLPWGRPRADVVAVLVVLALLLSHVLTPQEPFAGFGDPVVIRSAVSSSSAPASRTPA